MREIGMRMKEMGMGSKGFRMGLFSMGHGKKVG